MRIGIYPRKSVYRDNSDSVAVQVNMCKEYANIIYRDQILEFIIYDKDEGFSGKNINRPSFQEMMADIINKRLDVVMVYKLDRISRNVQEFSAMYETFQEYNVAFVSVKESFDTTTPIGRTVMYILAAFAQLERENTSERVGDNMLSLAASGKWTGGNLPPGMKSFRKETGGKEHSFLAVDEKNIGLVKLLFELILNGYSITALERYCRDHGIKSQTGKFLNTSQIYNTLTNPVYCQNSEDAYHYFQDQGCSLPDIALFDGTKGLLAYGKTKTGKTNQSKQDKSQWTISVGVHDFVIDSDNWIAAQGRLGVNKQIRSNKYEIGILKGALMCKCGSRMANRVYKKNNIQFAYYYCQARHRKGEAYCNCSDAPAFVKISTIDQLFLDKLKEMKLNKEFILLQSEPNIVHDEEGVRKNLKNVENAIRNLTTALSDNTDSSAAKYIISQIENLDKEQNIYTKQLRDIDLVKQKKRNLEETRENIYSQICYLLDNFETLSYTEKNESVKRIVQSCVLDGNSLEIIF